MSWQEFSSRLAHFSAADRKDIERAFILGEKAHAGQKRKSGDPYFTHPIAVAQILIDLGADRDTVIAALLHDTLEDTELTLHEIEKEFGESVGFMIDGLTKLDEDDLPEKPTLNQKIETLRKIFTLMQEDIRIMVIKLADRFHNMQTISFRKAEKQHAVAKETLDIYVKIADRLCMRELRDDMEGLCHAIIEPETHASLCSLESENRKEAIAIVEKMEKTIHAFTTSFESRLIYEKKSWEKLRMQFDMQQESPTGKNMLNIAFVCESVDACYATLGILHQLWPREAMTFDDNINVPIINGYRGLHTTIIMPDGTRVRCKIRDKEMQEYARRGIAMYCFDSARKGILNYLSWTRHIDPLSQDTEDRSDEFWESLQSDILSESMIVYGSNGRTSVIPKGATALDGAFYLYPESALKLSSIRVGGKDVSLSHELQKGDFIEITVNDIVSLERSWLYLVQTGTGIAMVRAALAQEKNSDLTHLGKSILQKEITERGKGYIEEMSDRRMHEAATTLGYDSLDALYIAIAGRHLEPIEILKKIGQLNQGKKNTGTEKTKCIVHFSISSELSSMSRLLRVYEKFNTQTSDIRLKFSPGQSLRMKVDIHLSPEDQDSYRAALMAAGADDVSIVPKTRSEFALMSIVVLAWALNPVWARHLLLEGVMPATLVSIRSIFFCLFACGMYAMWRRMQGKLFSPIKNGLRISVLPAIGSFVLAFLTYISVSFLAPSAHLTILRFNMLLLPIIHLFYEKKLSFRSSIYAICIFIVCTGLLLLMPTGLSQMGVGFALLSLAAYVYYSLVTERTLRANKIGARHPEFLLYFGIILGIFGALLLPFQLSSIAQWEPYLLEMGLYVLLCVFVPHTCFHLVLQRVRFRHITSFSLLEVPIAMLFEIFLLGLVLSPSAYLLLAALLSIVPVLLYRRRLA